MSAGDLGRLFAPARALGRLLDLRAGERGPLTQVVGTLFLLIAGHTMLETARDALFMRRLPASRLALVYALLAGLGFIAAKMNALFVRRFGQRNALVVSLMIAATAAVLLQLMPDTAEVAFVLYLYSGLIGAVLVVQFWMLAGRLFNVSQGKRLFGIVAAGGVLGAVVGSAAAAALVEVRPVSDLLLVAAAVFLGSAIWLTGVDVPDVTAAPAPAPSEGLLGLLFAHPYLFRMAALTVLATAAMLTTDYLFKSVAASLIPAAELARFFARYYAVINSVALLTQLLLAGYFVRRLGVAAALMVTPLFLLVGGLGTAALSGALAAVLLTKGTDGALRHSLHRVSVELLWMPVPDSVRDRAKGFFDTSLNRLVQAGAAGLILGLSMVGLDSPSVLGALIALCSLGWLAIAATLRSSYLDLFRQALAAGRSEPVAFELDLNSAEVVLEALSSFDSEKVLAAIDLAAARGRGKLIPALILYHDQEVVLLRALEVVAVPGRKDWIPLARRLLSHAAESVRVSAIRALALVGEVQVLKERMFDISPKVRAHAAFWLVEAERVARPEDDQRIQEILGIEGPAGVRSRAALLDAIQAIADPRYAEIVHRLANSHEAEIVEAAAKAMSQVPDDRFLPLLISRLAYRDGRAAVRVALTKLGDPALEAVAAALEDPKTDPRVLVHIPRTISSFKNQRAADLLTGILRSKAPGLVRYKALRGLGRLVRENSVSIDRQGIENELKKSLEEHLKILSLATPVSMGLADLPVDTVDSARLLVGLLEDKLRQSLERAFRLLQIRFRFEELERVYFAIRSTDKRVRAQAQEFVDGLLRDGVSADAGVARELLVVLLDSDLAAREKVDRLARFLEQPPSSYAGALALLQQENDASLVAIALHHGNELSARAAIEGTDAASLLARHRDRARSGERDKRA